MYVNLSGLNILLTGGSGDIGKAIASRLAEAGATVALHYHSKEREAENLAHVMGNNSRAFSSDFSKSENVSKLVEQTVQEMGEIDAVVNSVGTFSRAPMETTDAKWLSEWHKVMNINLASVAFLCKKCVEHWTKKKMPGRIVNIGSSTAFTGDDTEKLHYTISKAGLITLTRSLAKSFAHQGIRAWTLLPGKIKSNIGKKLYAQEKNAQTTAPDTAYRGTEPRDVAPMVAFLCGGLADYASGATIDVNTGSHD